MQLTAIILCAACLGASASGLGQKITLSEKDAPLPNVLHEIERQSGYQFLFFDNDMRQARKVTIDVKDMDFLDLLARCFQDQPLSYEIVDRTVVITLRTSSSTTQPAVLSEPPIDVYGQITDENGKPMQGVDIIIKGRKIGTVTDAAGNFAFRSIDPNATIVVSYVGYETQNIKLKERGRGNLDIKLKIAPKSLQDVVINKGYYSTTQRLNTGNVAVVKGEDIQKQPVTDLLLAIEGRVPGLDIVQNSGVPGAYSTVRIRGDNSLTAGSNKPVTANDPLFIVDGVPFSSQTLTSPFIGGGILNGANSFANQNVGQGLSPFNSLNPADIESIEVLKDADATAIYGSRGSNGVILITTKKGRPGIVRADMNVYTGVNRAAKEFHLLNTRQYLDMRYEALRNDGGSLASASALPSYLQQIFFPDLLTWDTTRYTDWQKIMIDKASPFTNANFNLSSGSTNTQFLLGAGYSDNSTTMPGNYKNQQLSLHFAITNISPNKRLQTQFTGSYSYGNSNLPADNLVQYVLLAPDAPKIYDGNGNLNWEIHDGFSTWLNPFAFTVRHFNSVTDYFQGGININYEIAKGLNFKSNFGYSKSQMNQTNTTPSSSKPPPLNTFPSFRSSSFSTSDNRSWILEPGLNYHVHFGKNNIEALVLASVQSTSYDSRAETASGFSSDDLLTNIMAATTASFAGIAQTEYHYLAFSGRLGYNWDEKYIFNITARRDGSSRFGPSKQFGDFGAVGAGWIFSQEKPFEEHLKWLSFGKIRGSYGITGNDGIGDYQFMSTYSPNSFSYQGVSGLTPTLLSNPYFRWEEVQKLEGALELGFLKDRVNATISRYRNRTVNQLVSYPLPGITGFGNITANLPAIIQNMGWEFTLNSTNVKTKDFTWRTTANLSIPRNKLVSFPGIENTPYRTLYSVGHSLATSYLYHYTGVDPQTGYYQFASKSGTGIADPATDQYFADLSHYLSGGMENSISYKGIQLDFFFQFEKRQGQKYATALAGAPGLFKIAGANEPVDILNRWQKPGDLASIQRVSTVFDFKSQQTFGQFQGSDGAITDASFVRLKNVSFSWNLPARWDAKARLTGARLYLQCENVLTITKYSGLDPETQGLSMPPIRTIIAGLSLTL